MKKILLACALTGLFSVDAFALDTFLSTDKGSDTRTKLNNNFTALDTGKEPAVYVGPTAPADTTKSFLDTDEEPGVIIRKKYVTGTGWVREGSYGVQYLADCSAIPAGMCVDSAGKLWYHNGIEVVEVGTGSGSIPTASAETPGVIKVGPRLTITDGVLSADVQSGTFDPTADIDFTGDVDFTGARVIGILPTGTEGQIPVYNSSGALAPTTPLTPVAGQSITLPVSGDTITINAWGDDTAYGSEWNGSTKPVSQNAIYDKIESMGNGGASAIADLTDWPSGLTATELGYVDGATRNIQSQINDISAGSGGTVTATTSAPYSDVACTGAKYDTVANRFYPCIDGYHTAYITGIANNNPSPSDTIPNAFVFTDVTDANISTDYTSIVQISGIDTPISCSGSGGTVASCTGSTIGTCGTFGSTSGAITNSQYVAAKITSSSSASTTVNNVVTCGGVSDTFSVTTSAAAASWFGSSTLQSDTSLNEPTQQYFYPLGVSPNISGTLTKYRVSIGAASATDRSLNICLYTNNGGVPGTLITGSCTGDVVYAGKSVGDDFEVSPLGAPSITSGSTYWVATLAKNYGSIRINSSVGTYYDNYTTSPVSSYTTGASHTGTAGKLQIEITP